MKPTKKNVVWTFICSFLPGAAEMYMGFMKMGLSIMAIFFLSFLIPMTIFNGSDVFLILAAFVWFFGFFHARNMATADDEAFMQLEDQFVWEEFTDGEPVKISSKTGYNWIAAILILFGFGILWSNFRPMFYMLIPDEVWTEVYPIVEALPGTIMAIIIIIIGVKMILGKKEELDGKGN